MYGQSTYIRLVNNSRAFNHRVYIKQFQKRFFFSRSVENYFYLFFSLEINLIDSIFKKSPERNFPCDPYSNNVLETKSVHGNKGVCNHTIFIEHLCLCYLYKLAHSTRRWYWNTKIDNLVDQTSTYKRVPKKTKQNTLLKLSYLFLLSYFILF